MHFILSEQGWQNSIRFVTINISRLLRTSGLKVSMGKSLAVFRNNCLSLHSSCVKKAKKSTFLKKKRLWFACSFIELKCMWLQTVLAYLKNTKQLKCCLKPCTHDQIAYVCKFCIYAKFAYVRKSGHVYAFTHVCKICTYAKVGKYAPASDQVQISFCVYAKFAYMQIWSCEQKAKFAHVSIYLIVLNNC